MRTNKKNKTQKQIKITDKVMDPRFFRSDLWAGRFALGP